MKLCYSWSEVERWRDRTHRRTASLGVKNERQALRFINEVGFCLASKTNGLELPNLWDAVTSGMSLTDSKNTHRSYYLSYALEIQSILPNHNSVYYGKVFKRRPSVVSREYFPYFFALSGRTGTAGEHETEHEHGKLTLAAKELMDLLLKHSPLTSKELRASAAGHRARKNEQFDRALDELQRKMFITRVVGTGNHFTSTWAPVIKCFALEVRRARKITVDHARYKLLEKYFHNQLITCIDQIHKVFGWQRKDIFHAIGQLINEGIVATPATLERETGKYYCLVRSPRND